MKWCGATGGRNWFLHVFFYLLVYQNVLNIIPSKWLYVCYRTSNPEHIIVKGLHSLNPLYTTMSGGNDPTLFSQHPSDMWHTSTTNHH